jgi:RNA-directed DNA polymerase
VLPKHFGKYGLTLLPEKTRLVPFRPPTGPDGPGPNTGPPSGPFDLLGFTHFWARSRRGLWVVMRRTPAGRLRRAVRSLAPWCRCHCHEPLAARHRTLGQKLCGHFAYYGITGNGEALRRFRDAVARPWRF